MNRHQIFITEIKKFDNILKSNFCTQCKSFRVFDELPVLINYAQYIDEVSRNEIQHTLLNYKNWQCNSSKILSSLSEEKKQSFENSSNHYLKKVIQSTGEIKKAKETDVINYYYAMCLVAFFNSKENWTIWTKQLENEAWKLQCLKKLEEQWFLQQEMAIASSKVLVKIQKQLDNIRLYLSALRLDIKLHGKKVTNAFHELVQQHILQVEEYIGVIEKQLIAAARFRLKVGITINTPMRDGVVNYVKEELENLGIYTATVTDNTSIKHALQSAEQLCSIEKIIKNPLLEKNQNYLLKGFGVENISYLENTDYLELQTIAAKKVKYSNRNSDIYKLIAPAGIDIPLQRPRWPRIFSTQTFKYDIAKKQQLLIKSSNLLNKKDLTIKTITFKEREFDRSDEKAIFNDLTIFRDILIDQLTNIKRQIQKHDSIFYFRRRAFLMAWKDYYEKQLIWIDNQIYNWFNAIIFPITDHLDESNKQIIYYKKIVDMLETIAISGSFTIQMKQKLKENIKSKIHDLENGSNWKNILKKKTFIKNDLFFVEKELLLLIKDKESIEKNQEKIRHLVYVAKSMTVNVNNYFYKLSIKYSREKIDNIEETDRNMIETQLATLLYAFNIIEKIREKATEFGLEHLVKSCFSVSQKISHLMINVLTQFGCNVQITKIIKILLEKATEKLGESKMEHLAIVYEKLDKVLFSLNRIEKYTEDIGIEAEKLLTAHHEQFEKILFICKQTQDSIVLLKNLKKLKPLVEDTIKHYLEEELKFVGSFDIFMDLKNSAWAIEEILNNQNPKGVKRNFVIICPNLANIIAFARYIDTFDKLLLQHDEKNIQLDEDIHYTAKHLSEMLETSIALYLKAFPKTKAIQNTTNNLIQFFTQKFTMAKNILLKQDVSVNDKEYQHIIKNHTVLKI